jgi:hypothetical protein
VQIVHAGGKSTLCASAKLLILRPECPVGRTVSGGPDSKCPVGRTLPIFALRICGCFTSARRSSRTVVHDSPWLGGPAPLRPRLVGAGGGCCRRTVPPDRRPAPLRPGSMHLSTVRRPAVTGTSALRLASRRLAALFPIAAESKVCAVRLRAGSTCGTPPQQPPPAPPRNLCPLAAAEIRAIVHHPAFSNHQPAISIQHPAISTHQPAISFHQPAAGNQQPPGSESSFQVRGSPSGSDGDREASRGGDRGPRGVATAR